ncbi:hypothetical protein LIPSTDRAFT_30920 [Lipomyces starkeyi NRRL Y-11557]|uniref:Chromo domain-containing protein n=1 Tax=Lipomyces starkeyi NRRL Y-11557 TaxID=675824 RepID=A0A1E3PUL1_LIPST|nr:hypothetical protein LIPSTDRAFT_30920 [Lipomyces starkeyi NRRL Y-11557]
MCIHPVFHIELLEPYHDSVAGQQPEENVTMPTYTDGHQEWNVHAIVDASRDMPDGQGQIYFHVKWEGYDDEQDDTWDGGSVRSPTFGHTVTDRTTEFPQRD